MKGSSSIREITTPLNIPEPPNPIMLPRWRRAPIEAQLIDYADEIAYNAADLDDGYEAKLLNIDMIRSTVPLFAKLYDEVDRKQPQGVEKLKFNEALKRLLDHLVTDLIENTRAAEVIASAARTPSKISGGLPDARGWSYYAERLLKTHSSRKFLLERLLQSSRD